MTETKMLPVYVGSVQPKIKLENNDARVILKLSTWY